MAKKTKTNLAEEAEKLKNELELLKEQKKQLDAKDSKSKKAKTGTKKQTIKAEKKTTEKKTTEKKTTEKKTTEKNKVEKKKAEKKKAEKKTTEKNKVEKKTTEKKKVEKKPAKEEPKEEKTYEEELEEQLTDEEIENFQIEKVNMEQLTNKVCEIIAKYESEGTPQSELWKKLKLTSRDGSRLALKLERMGIITREKILEKGRWTYKLILKKTPISTQSIENAPCLVCPVEQKCTLEGEISPRTCQFIEDWVLVDLKKPKKSQ